MKNLMVSEFSMADVVFEHRNQGYGAFALRKNYNKNMSKAFFIASLLFVSGFLIPKILDVLNPSNNFLDTSLADKIHEIYVPIFKEKIFIPKYKPVAPGSSNNPKIASTPIIVQDSFVQKNKSKPDEFSNNINATDNADTNTNHGTNESLGNNIAEGTSSNFGLESNFPPSEELILVPDEFPVFNADYNSLKSYLAKHIKYPPFARDNNIEGKVIVEFIIDKNGYAKSPKILSGIGGGCDEEVIRVIHALPKWKAGLHHGKPVNVKMILPVSFNLN